MQCEVQCGYSECAHAHLSISDYKHLYWDGLHYGNVRQVHTATSCTSSHALLLELAMGLQLYENRFLIMYLYSVIAWRKKENCFIN